MAILDLNQKDGSSQLPCEDELAAVWDSGFWNWVGRYFVATITNTWWLQP